MLHIRTTPCFLLTVLILTILIGLVFAGSGLCSAGQLDPSFGTGGKLDVDFQGATYDDGFRVLSLSDGRSLVLFTLYGGGYSDTAVLRMNADGTLDTMLARMDAFYGTAFALQSDGKIVIAGSGPDATGTDDFVVVRLLADGSADPSFGINGKARTDLGGYDEARAVSIQTDGKIVAAGYSGGAGYDLGLVRYDANGNLDPSFGGGDGIVVTDFAGRYDFAQAMALQSDGKIVAAGYSYISNADFLIARYNADGTLDTSFNGTGYVFLDTGSTNDRAAAVAVQPDGRVVVAGTNNTGNYNYVVARYNSNGALDGTFGSGGTAIIDFGNHETTNDMVLQPDGKILLAGMRYTNNQDCTIVRLNGDGSLDTGFGTGGTTVTAVNSDNDQALGLALQGDGRILVAGDASFSGDRDVLLLRYLADGTLDTGFDGDGMTTMAFQGSTDNWLTDMVMQRDGKVVAVGSLGEAADNARLTLVRFNAAGLLDPTFGTAGKVTTDSTGYADAVGLQTDGKIVVAGTTTGANFFVARYDIHGNLDASFGGSGIVTTDLGGYDIAQTLALQPDGKIVVGGYSNSSLFALVRYNPDGALDASFGSGGIVVTDLGAAGGGQFVSIAVLNNGKIVAAGYANGGATVDFLVARFDPNGSLDTGFGTSGGFTTTDFLGDYDEAYAMAVQPDGKILVGGEIYDPGTAVSDFGLVRYNPDGSLDSSFGSGGTATADLGGAGYYDWINAVAVSPDGKIVAAGAADNGTYYNLAVARWNPDGTLDTSFDGDGMVTSDFGNYEEADALLIGPDGKIWAGGYSTSLSTSTDLSVVRYMGSDDLLSDDFEDGVLDWTIKKGNWVEQAGELTVGMSNKSLAFAPTPWSPSGASSCSNCSIEIDVQTDGGPYSKVFLEGWYQNGANKVDLILNEPADKWILKQHSGGTTVAAAKVSRPIVPGASYHVEITFDGSVFRVFVDGDQIIGMNAGGPAAGNLALKVKNTSAAFRQVRIF